MFFVGFGEKGLLRHFTILTDTFIVSLNFVDVLADIFPDFLLEKNIKIIIEHFRPAIKMGLLNPGQFIVITSEIIYASGKLNEIIYPPALFCPCLGNQSFIR